MLAMTYYFLTNVTVIGAILRLYTLYSIISVLPACMVLICCIECGCEITSSQYQLS